MFNRQKSILFACALLLGFSVPAQAATPLYAQYEIYAGGLHAVTGKIAVEDTAKSQYRFHVDARTQGFLSHLIAWQGTFDTNGWKESKGLQPQLHRSTAAFSFTESTDDINEFHYNSNGTFKKLLMIEDKTDKTPPSVDPQLADGTIDVLTATLNAMDGVEKKNSCESTAHIFDGRRRFRLVFSHGQADTVPDTGYNVYHGPAIRCDVEVVPEGGAWKSKTRGWLSIQEQGRDRGALPRVWFAKLTKDGPAVPVKLLVKTDYGTLIAHLAAFGTRPGQWTMATPDAAAMAKEAKQ